MSRLYTTTKRGTVSVCMRPTWHDGEDLRHTVAAYLAGPYLALHRPVRVSKGEG
ncbi:hypothetical protein LCGC14_2791750, partial [marine sediment metagenome]